MNSCLTAPYLAYLQAGWDIVDPSFVCWNSSLPLDCDFAIFLSHLGKAVDEKIAKNYDIDLIIGSHTHHLFEHGAELHGTHLQLLDDMESMLVKSILPLIKIIK